jgi:uncharacterized protein (TIGR03382 family)
MRTALFTLAAVLAASSAQADSITITDQVSPDDARVDSDNPNTVYQFEGDGNDVFMFSGADYSTAGGNFPIIQFDLGVPTGETIDTVTSAVLTLRTRSAYPADLQFTINRLTSSFDEDTVTFNNRPAADTSTAVVYDAPDPSGVPDNTEVQIDVSSLLAQNGGLDTFGLAIELTGGSSGKYVQLAELGDSNGTPSLTAAFTTIPEPASLALAGLGGLALLGRPRRR